MDGGNRGIVSKELAPRIPSAHMLVTLFVVCYLRPLLQDKARRERVLSIILIASCFALSDGGWNLARAGEAGQRLSSNRLHEDSDSRLTPTSAADGSKRRPLREGTLISNAPGRIVLIGRRWAFLPDRAEADLQGATSSHSNAPARTAATPRVNRTTSLLQAQADQPPTSHQLVRQRNFSASAYQSARLISQNAADSESPPIARHITLAENQLLQRIVEATRADSSDDHWEVSGEVLEFFDENRLLLRTVQRADRNDFGDNRTP